MSKNHKHKKNDKEKVSYDDLPPELQNVIDAHLITEELLLQFKFGKKIDFKPSHLDGLRNNCADNAKYFEEHKEEIRADATMHGIDPDSPMQFRIKLSEQTAALEKLGIKPRLKGKTID